jgi:hypothetical protein
MDNKLCVLALYGFRTDSDKCKTYLTVAYYNDAVATMKNKSINYNGKATIHFYDNPSVEYYNNYGERVADDSFKAIGIRPYL